MCRPVSRVCRTLEKPAGGGFQVIEKLPPLAEPEPLRYQITDGVLDRWVYSPAGYEKPAVETVFTAEDL